MSVKFSIPYSRRHLPKFIPIKLVGIEKGGSTCLYYKEGPINERGKYMWISDPSFDIKLFLAYRPDLYNKEWGVRYVIE
jgi:hypothetical protein